MIGEEYPGQVAEIEWASSDFERTIRFYEELLGWKFERFEEQGVICSESPRNDFRCTFRRGKSDGSGGCKVVVHVASLATSEMRVLELGGSWHGERVERFGAQTSEVGDPDGNVLILVDGAEGKV